MSGLILRAANDFTVVFLGTSRSDDSTGDRLSYRYTCAILIAFTIIVSNREFTLKRIQCWVPAFFTENYEEYANHVCWVRNTYYLNDDSHIPESLDVRRESSIRYYQWIPFILLFQAFFFFFPYVIWRVLCQRSGIDIRDVVEAAANYKKSTDENKRQQLMNFMVSVIDQYVDDPRRQSNNRETVWWKKFFLMFFPSSGRYMGDYLRNLFIFIKILYVINVFGQVLLLSFLLGQPFWSLGFTVIKFLYEGKSWDYHSRYFPKVTLCDFEIREPNTIPLAHTYTVMCVLPINLFNQQIFTFLWFWFVIVIVLTVYDLCIWIYRLFFRREIHLEARLKVIDWEIAQKWPYKDACIDHINAEENEHLMEVQTRKECDSTGDQFRVLSDGRRIHHQSRMFIVPRSYYQQKRSIFQFFNYEYLESDGHFILRIIGTNASDFVTTKIIHKLYILCCEKRFRADEVPVVEHEPRMILYKYLIIPKGQTSSTTDPSKLDQTSNDQTRSATNQDAPHVLPRSSSNNELSPSDMGPSILDPERRQQLSKRSHFSSKKLAEEEE